jgi:hypothetical protein
MSTVITVVTVVAALSSAALLVYASFESPAASPTADFEGHTQYMRSVRALGVRGAILALIGTYLVLFLT